MTMGSAPERPGKESEESDDSSSDARFVTAPRVSRVRSGTWVTPSVRIERPLGEGGMGSVWVAHHTTLDARVAVKLISQRLDARHELARKRFEREARIAAKLQHPHVIQIYDHGITEDGVPYIVMELLEGETLAARLRRVGQLSARETEMLVSQLAKVLTMAHETGVVHRDLKPDNVFLLESDYELFVKVLDFGIAKQTEADVLGELTHTGALVGTPLYMSPELLMGDREVDRRADLWGLAVMAYHSLTGRLPFQGETLAALGVSVNEGVFAPASALAADVGPEIDAWFKVALCRKADLRFQTAREMAQAFRSAVQRGDPSSDDGAVPRSRTPVSVSGERLRTRDRDDDRSLDALTPDAVVAGDSEDLGGEAPTVEAPMSPVGDLDTNPLDPTPADIPAEATKREPAGRRWAILGLGATVIAAGALWTALSSDATEAGARVEVPAAIASEVVIPESPAPSAVDPAVEAPPEATALPSASSRGAQSPPLHRRPGAGSTPPVPVPAASSAATPVPHPTGEGLDCSYPFTVGPAGELIPIRECLE